MATAHFIYRPRSCSRIIAQAERLRVPVMEWANGSAHVVGTDVHVIASIPGAWWRNQARDIAGAIAATCGGVAYDDCGVVGVVVPDECAASALAAFAVAAPARVFDQEAARLLTGLDVALVEHWRQVAQVLPADAWVRRFVWAPVFERRWTYTQALDGDRRVVAFEASTGESVRVAAPRAWGEPTIIGAIAAPEPAPREVPEGFEEEDLMA